MNVALVYILAYLGASNVNQSSLNFFKVGFDYCVCLVSDDQNNIRTTKKQLPM